MNDIASLHASCRSWRDWLNSTQLQLNRYRECTPSRLPLLRCCGWASRAVTKYQLLPQGDSELAVEGLRQALLLMTSVPSLQRLEIRSQVMQLDDSVAQLALQCFIKVRILHLDAPAPLLQTMLRHIHHLRSLQEFTLLDELNAESDIDTAALDFSQLALLPQLQHARIFPPDAQGTFRLWSLTSAQVTQLVACQSLTVLSAGQWSLKALIGQPTYQQQVDEHLGQLVRSVLARPSHAAAEGHESAPLHFLDLSTSIMTPAVWRHVSQLTDLTELNTWWSPELAEADWSKLSGMHQLQTLNISFRDGNLSLQHLNWALAALPPSVSSVHLCCGHVEFPRWNFGVEQMRLLLSSLPHLRCLGVEHLRINIDALTPLAHAPHLHTLIFDGCAGTKAEAQMVRLALPLLPHLTALIIDDEESVRLTTAEATPLTAVLLQRCPKLTRDTFKQNLKG